MARSIWKGPFIDGYLLKKAEVVRSSGRNDVIKTWVTKPCRMGLLLREVKVMDLLKHGNRAFDEEA